MELSACQQRRRGHKASNDPHKVSQVSACSLPWSRPSSLSGESGEDMGLTKKGKILLSSLATLIALGSIVAFAVSIGKFGGKFITKQTTVFSFQRRNISSDFRGRSLAWRDCWTSRTRWGGPGTRWRSWWTTRTTRTPPRTPTRTPPGAGETRGS